MRFPTYNNPYILKVIRDANGISWFDLAAHFNFTRKFLTPTGPVYFLQCVESLIQAELVSCNIIEVLRNLIPDFHQDISSDKDLYRHLGGFAGIMISIPLRHRDLVDDLYKNTVLRPTALIARIQYALDISLSDLSLRAAPIFGRPDQKADVDVFVLMPFASEMTDIYYNHIAKIVEKNGITCKRADELFEPGVVMRDIWSFICAAKAIIADCTGRNPNVFYEMGIAHTIGKTVILVTQEERDIPFDIRHLRYIKYAYTPPGMEKFEKDLIEAILSLGVQGGVS
jgi:hypothetical protein